MGANEQPQRKKLPHGIPHWIDPSAEIYFLTVNSRPCGHNQLCTEEAGRLLMESSVFRHRAGTWFIHLLLLMPDHVHALLSFPRGGAGIQATLKAWKAWTAKCAGIAWQRDFFEHRLRAGESASEKFHYILQNPVRAGLAGDPADWPWLLWCDPRGGDLHQGWGTQER